MELRGTVDYALDRRATLRDLRTGRRSLLEVCDAHPYLIRAARFHGTPTEVRCPVCQNAATDLVTYVFGDGLGEASGRPRKPAELPALVAAHGELTVYDIEVCRSCSWNFLVHRYTARDDEPAPRKKRAAKPPAEPAAPARRNQPAQPAGIPDLPDLGAVGPRATGAGPASGSATGERARRRSQAAHPAGGRRGPR